MPFPMKIQPISDTQPLPDSAKPVLKSRLRRLFDRNVLRISSTEKPAAGNTETSVKDGAIGDQFEPSSVCLAKMVQNFIEESNEKQTSVSMAKCGRNRCNCFNGNGNESSDEEFESWNDAVSYGDNSDVLKSLVLCASVTERNLLADTAKIVEQNKNSRRKEDLRKIVTDNLLNLGYHASICKSRWEKCPSFPAGEYDYIDVILEGGERLLIDLDFKSEFEIARPTGTYKAILQSLPFIFVGKSDRLQQIISTLSEAAKQSLKKKGMPIPPWRKPEYMKSKWLSPYTRASQNDVAQSEQDSETEEVGELNLIFGEESSPEETKSPAPAPWKLPAPAVKPRSVERGAKMVTGLASLLREKP